MTTTISPLSYVYDGRQCLGFILRRGKLGFEAIDHEEVSLGLFTTAKAAANAVFDAAISNKKAPHLSGASSEYKALQSIPHDA